MPENETTKPAAAQTPDYHYPPMDKRRVIGKPYKRLDGLAKSTGAAKYNSDIKPPGMLFAILLTSPYAHARVKSIDTSAAEKLQGVTAVQKIIEGKLNAFYEQYVLVDQPSIRDPKVTIGAAIQAVIAKLGENIAVSRFVRYKVGESA